MSGKKTHRPKVKRDADSAESLSRSVDAAFKWDGVAGGFFKLDGATVFFISRGCDASGFSGFCDCLGTFSCNSLEN